MKQILVTIDSARSIIQENPDSEYYSKKLKLPGITVTDNFSDQIETADVLYITQVEGFFDSEHEFPSFEAKFALRKQSSIKKKNGFRYQHQTWTPKNTLELRNDFMYNK